MFWIKNKIMYTPVNPIFSIQKWGVKGSSFHGHVSMMNRFSYDSCDKAYIDL